MTPIILVVSTMLLMSFYLNEKKVPQKSQEKISTYPAKLSDVKSLVDSKCMICHSIKEKQDAMMAPPFAHIKKKYAKVYSDKGDFIQAITSFTMNPTKDKAQMYGALKQFKLMPKLSYKQSDVEAIAAYIYETDFPEPAWCANPKGRNIR